MMMLTRDQARQEVRGRWREIILHYTTEAAKRVSGKETYICPFCKHGQGGDGIKDNPKSKDGNGIICFSCGFSGDIIDFIMKDTGADYNTAFKMAADHLGIQIEPYRPTAADDFKDAAGGRPGAAQTGARDQGGEMSAERPKAAQGAQEADYTEYYELCKYMFNDSAGLSYIQGRGISEKTAQAYHVGFDPAADPASAPGAMDETTRRPHPAQRVIIPVTKSYYVARRIDGISDYKVSYPKGSRQAIFNAQALYKDHGAVFITEGAIDALSIIEGGGMAIATNSANNTQILLDMLEKKPTKSALIICPDNDGPGQRAAEKLDKGLDALNIRHMIYSFTGGKDANDALRADRAAFIQAVKAAEDQAKALPIRDYLTAFFEKISGEAYRPYTTDITWFDNLLSGGPVRQTVLLLLAAPAAGKTTLCQQISESMARHGKPVLYLNLEMTREQMISKSISARCTFRGQHMTALDVMQGYKWTDQQRKAVTNALTEYRERIAPCLNYNPEGITADFDAIQKYLHRTGEAARAAGQPAPVVVLDYLHLVSHKGFDVQETIKQSMDMLKQYSMKYDTFSIAITATNRESNKSGRITMESGRDSSGIEYGGDYILSLNYYQVDQGKVKPTSIEEVALLQGRTWRQMIVRVLKGRLCIPGRSARVYFHSAGNMFYAEDAFLPDDESRVEFGQYDDELEELKAALRAERFAGDSVQAAPKADKGKNVTARF